MDESCKGHRERVRKRYERAGLENFEPHETLELLLQFSLPRKDTKQIAHGLINMFGGVNQVLSADMKSLMKCKGVGERTAILITTIHSFMRYCAKEELNDVIKILDTKSAGEYASKLTMKRLNEVFYVISLDSARRVICADLISQGGIGEVLINMRSIVESVMKNNTNAVILVHNHTNGSLNPSGEDIRITSEIVRILAAVNVTVIDHIITCEEKFSSLADKGFI